MREFHVADSHQSLSDAEIEPPLRHVDVSTSIPTRTRQIWAQSLCVYRGFCAPGIIRLGFRI